MPTINVQMVELIAQENIKKCFDLKFLTKNHLFIIQIYFFGSF